MKVRTRTILIIAGTLVAITVSILAYGAWSIYSLFSGFGSLRQVPAVLAETGVKHGAGRLTRREMFKLESEGLFRTILDQASSQKSEAQKQRETQAKIAIGIYDFSDVKVIGSEIVAIGQFGGFFFDLKGNLIRSFSFEAQERKQKIGPWEQSTFNRMSGDLSIVELEPGKVGVVSHNSINGFVVYDDNGNVTWSIGADPDRDLFSSSDEEIDKKIYVTTAAAGDITGDGFAEYIVGKRNDGYRAYDRTGTELWFVPDELPYGEWRTDDVDGDGKLDIIFSPNRVFGASGVVKTDKELPDPNEMVFLKGTDSKVEVQALSDDNGKLVLTDSSGKEILRGDAPFIEVKLDKDPSPTTDFDFGSTERASKRRAEWIVPRPGSERFLIVVASYILVPRSNVYVYGQDGKLIYHELLDQNAETLAVVPGENGTQEFVIGGHDTIFRYSFK